MATSLFMPIQQHVVAYLKKNLSPHLTYHCLSHTLDVLALVQKIAVAEGINSSEELLLLKVAALYHDSGFTHSYQDHEIHSREMARQDLPEFGFSPTQIDRICGMINATRIPQLPQNHLEQIICDADLDYLGRNDFKELSHALYQELKYYNKISGEDEWLALQITFLEKHTFFTDFAKQNREKNKQAHLLLLRTTARQVQ